ncbi:MAG: ThiF family adenylyltransferase [Proteobacteria bacterium]|nr:ThiF family adenylyltransferase [Pseudomonadota bacterium]MBU1387150.1 ThiF family adenylyltransferase [Pseudomonadota bacterium]MBU1541533.1 ThiF family adenylyltransferase [Pseudomonadota bacterium]MBU2481838.1 ThiF family adenylyltransferase [Pseudomonadota bacterium]
MTDIFTSSKTLVIYETEKITGTHCNEHDVHNRHSLLKGFNQRALEKTRINLIGAGGLGSETGIALVRKGIGELNIYDSDRVDITNLSRQHYFRKDLYKPKAGQLSENLSQMATGKSIIRGVSLMIQEAVDQKKCFDSDIVIVGVDNSETRFYCSEKFKDKPVIFTAVNPEADSGYVFVQEKGGACFGCLFGDQNGRPARKCAGATIDINKVMGGIVSYAVDTLIMRRQRDWNFKQVHFHGPFIDFNKKILKEPECRFC